MAAAEADAPPAVAAAVAAVFAADANSDGVLDAREAGEAGIGPDAFAAADADGDGKLGAVEAQLAVLADSEAPVRIAGADVVSSDTVLKGYLRAQELGLALGLDAIPTADTNGDGQLDDAELIALAAASSGGTAPVAGGPAAAEKKSDSNTTAVVAVVVVVLVLLAAVGYVVAQRGAGGSGAGENSNVVAFENPMYAAGDALPGSDPAYSSSSYHDVAPNYAAAPAAQSSGYMDVVGTEASASQSQSSGYMDVAATPAGAGAENFGGFEEGGDYASDEEV